MDYVTLNDLLTDTEKRSPFLTSFVEFKMDWSVTALTAYQLRLLFLVLYFPFEVCPNGTVIGIVWDELVKRAIAKNLPMKTV